MPTLKTRPTTESNTLSDLPDWLARILTSRGVQQLSELEFDFKQMPSPEQMLGAVAAAEVLADAIAQQARILIIADYDVDGATSCTLVKQSLELLGAQNVGYLVPDRFKLGYGLSPAVVELALEFKPDWLITVDNGIASVAGVRAAKAAGLGVIVTDHHLPGNDLPEADVIVNPNQPGCTFPTKALAGVGVAFYVMLALRQELRQRDWFNSQSIAEPNLAQMLDLVALGTVADLVPLDHLNRLLVKQGLKRINQGLTRPGIKTILQLARGEIEEVVAQDMGFAVAPRLNAAGRLDDMTLGIECLLSQTAAGALPLAERLNDWNVERRQIQQTMENEASNIAQSQAISDSTYTISLYSDNWHEGVVGLVASKIKDHYYRPTVVFAPAEQAGLIKGSARSIKGIHIRDVLDAVATRAPDVLQKFGGHAMAAGLTIEAQHLNAFSALFETVVQEVAEPETFDNVLWTDGELPAIALNLDTAQLIRHYGPWGQKFPEPLFEGTFRVLDTYVLKQRHLKFRLQTSAGKVIDAIAFNLSDDILSRHFEQIHIAYRLNVNHFRGQSKAQLMIEHIVS